MEKSLTLSKKVQDQVEMLRTAMTSTIRWSSRDVDTDLRPILEELCSVQAPDMEAKLRGKAFAGPPSESSAIRLVVDLDDALAIIAQAAHLE